MAVEWIWIAVVFVALGVTIAIVKSRGTTPTAPTHIPDAGRVDPAILDALREGHKIEAIKAYRELYGVGLRDAKDAIESFERTL